MEDKFWQEIHWFRIGANGCGLEIAGSIMAVPSDQTRGIGGVRLASTWQNSAADNHRVSVESPFNRRPKGFSKDSWLTIGSIVTLGGHPVREIALPFHRGQACGDRLPITHQA